MSSFLGHRVPDYTPFWEEDYNKEEPDWWQWYHLGHDDGYAVGSEYRDKLENLERENEALRALVSANVRVIKEELRLDQENKTPDEQV